MIPASTSELRIEDGLASIRRSFLDRLADRCLTIDAMLEQVQQTGWCRDSCHVIIHHAHKTVGIAGTLGYTRLGQLARAVEQTWTTGASSGAEIRHAIEQTGQFLDEIEKILDDNWMP